MSRRPVLRPGFDRDIYQIVRKLEDEEQERAEERGEKKPRRLTINIIYDAIKRSNSSLARQKKKPLEDSIERVLAVRKEESKADEKPDSDAEIEAAEAAAAEAARIRAEKDASLLNKQIAKSWGLANNMPKPSANGNGTSGAATPVTPKDDEDVVMGENGQPSMSRPDRQANGEPRPKKRKGDRSVKETVDRSPPTGGVTIRDIAGVDDTLDKLLHEVWFPLCAGEACEKMGYRYDNGVLLHGPSGCGKTTLANAVAGSVGAAFIPVSAPSIVSGTSGESEKNIRDVFDEAIRLAPCLVFIDEIDAIAGKRESANKGMEGRIVAEIMNGMDRIKQNTPLGKNVVVLAATNRPESLDPAIRRRFSSEIDMGMPNERAREQILRALSRNLNLADDVNFAELAKLTPGYVGSDLQYVVKAAVSESFRGNLDTLLEKARTLREQQSQFRQQSQQPDFGTESVEVTTTTTSSPFSTTQTTVSTTIPTTTPSDPDDLAACSQKQRDWILLEDHRHASWGESRISQAQFKTAISRVQPASKREGFSTIPDTTWANVGALDDVRKKLEMSIIGPIKQPELFTKVGIKPAAGILLWGPPGCGKTLVAKAVANESKANFISIKGPELLNKYVGESERAVRQLFARAKSSAPCILFFDEMDALVPKRDDSLSDASARVVNTLLTELDGVGDRSGIYVIGATNRPDIIDEAIRRPGRLGTSIYVGLPSAGDRVDILKTLYRNTIGMRAAAENGGDGDVAVDAVDLERVARDTRCTGFSGADLGNLMQAAAQACLERAYMSQLEGGGDESANGGEGGVNYNPVITMEDWERALREVKPSVKDVSVYEMAE